MTKSLGEMQNLFLKSSVCIIGAFAFENKLSFDLI